VSTTATTPAIQSGHVGLNVTDLARSTSFYARVFGLDVLGQSTDAEGHYAFLGAYGELLLTLWQQSDGRFEVSRPGLHHLSFQVPDMEAVRRAESTLRDVGATLRYDGVVRHQEGAGSAAVFFEDPDGIRLEIYTPSGAESEAVPAPTESAPACGFF
jgi:lactoylglutathione lyase